MPGTCPPDPRKELIELFNAVDEPLSRGDIVGARTALDRYREKIEQLELELANTEPS